MTTLSEQARLRREVEEFGELLAKHRGAKPTAPARDLAAYRDRPVAFIEDVLGGAPWAVQREIAEAVAADPRVVVRSCNGAGKDWLAARLALWWVFARGGLCVVLGPTERQVKEVVMRNEVRRAFGGAPDLPGELFEMALRVEGDGGGIVGMTSTNSSKLTGYHHPNGVLVVITEAQGVEDHTWEAAIANTTGESCAILAVGNPLSPIGRFFDVSRSASWRSFRVSAFDHPNVIEGREVVPGAVTRSFIETIRTEYGEESPQYRARVLAEFPMESEEALCRLEWLEAAGARWKEEMGDAA